MYSEQNISLHLTPELLSYIKNKNKGGTNNQKGNSYEFRFALLKICESAESYFKSAIDPELCSQTFCFIDDFTIKSGPVVSNFQVRDVQSLGWYSEPHPLKEDCTNQIDLNQKMGFSDSKITIVVSRNKVKDFLLKNTPFTTEPVDVIQFDFHANFEHYLFDPQFGKGLAELSPRTNPDEGDLNSVLTILAGEWAKLSSNCTKFGDFYQQLKRNRHNWVNRGKCDINDQSLESILSGIPSFNYNCNKGYFEWSYSPNGKQIDDGCFKETCDSPEFQRFAKRVKDAIPTTFSELEDML